MNDDEPLGGWTEHLDASIDRAMARILNLAHEQHESPDVELHDILATLQRDAICMATSLVHSIARFDEPQTDNRTTRWSSDGEDVSFR